MRAVGPVEVPRQLDPHHPGKPERHVAVAGEVEVDLEGVPERRRPALPDAHRARVRQQRVDPPAELVGDQHLLRQAEREEDESREEELGIEPVEAVELRLELAVADDRPRDQVREEGDEERVAERVPLDLHVAAEDVDHVRDRLEGVEADPDRQGDPLGERPERRQPAARDDGEERRRVPGRELCVLEVDEEAERADDAARQHGAPPARVGHARERDAGGERDHRRAGHERREPVLRVAVEDVAHDDDPDEARGLPTQREEDDEHDRQEDAEEGVAVEEH